MTPQEIMQMVLKETGQRGAQRGWVMQDQNGNLTSQLSPREQELLARTKWDDGAMYDSVMGKRDSSNYTQDYRDYLRAKNKAKGMQSWASDKDAEAQTAVDAEKAKQANVAAQLQEFYTKMNQPLDMNDPYVRQLSNVARDSSARDAEARGIGGPLAVRGAEDAVARQMTGLTMQRQGQGLQALGMAGNQLAGMQGQELDRQRMQMADRQFAYQMDMQNRMMQAQQRQGQAQGIGSLIGGGLGMAGGAALGTMIPGVGTGLGMMLGGTMGGGFGSQLGGGIGGIAGGGGGYYMQPYSSRGGLSSYGRGGGYSPYGGI